MSEKTVCSCALKKAVKVTTWINIVTGCIFVLGCAGLCFFEWVFTIISEIGDIVGFKKWFIQNVGTLILGILFLVSEWQVLVNLDKALRKELFMSATAALGAMSGIMGCCVYHATENGLFEMYYIYPTTIYLPFFLWSTYIVVQHYDNMATSGDG